MAREGSSGKPKPKPTPAFQPQGSKPARAMSALVLSDAASASAASLIQAGQLGVRHRHGRGESGHSDDSVERVVVEMTGTGGLYLATTGFEVSDSVQARHLAAAASFHARQLAGGHPSYALSPHTMIIKPPYRQGKEVLYRFSVALSGIDDSGLPTALSGLTAVAGGVLGGQAGSWAYPGLTFDGARQAGMWQWVTNGKGFNFNAVATDAFAGSSVLIGGAVNFEIIRGVIKDDMGSYLSASGQIRRGEVTPFEVFNGNVVRTGFRSLTGVTGMYLAMANAQPFVVAAHSADKSLGLELETSGQYWNGFADTMGYFDQATRMLLVNRSIQNVLSAVGNYRPQYKAIFCDAENPSWRADQVIHLLAANTRRVLRLHSQQQNIEALEGALAQLVACRRDPGQSDLRMIAWMDGVCRQFNEGTYPHASRSNLTSEQRVDFVKKTFPTLWQHLTGRFAHLSCSEMTALGIFGSIAAVCCVIYAIVQVPITEQGLMTLFGVDHPNPLDATGFEVASAMVGAGVNVAFYLDWALNGVIKAIDFMNKNGYRWAAFGLALDALTVLPGAAIARAGNASMLKIIASSVAAFAMNLPPIFRMLESAKARSDVSELLAKLPAGDRGIMQADLTAMQANKRLLGLLETLVQKAEAGLTSKYLPSDVEAVRQRLTASRAVVTSFDPVSVTFDQGKSSIAAECAGGYRSVGDSAVETADEILSDHSMPKFRNPEITALLQAAAAAAEEADIALPAFLPVEGDIEAGYGEEDAIADASATEHSGRPATAPATVHPEGWGDKETKAAGCCVRYNPCQWAYSAVVWCTSGWTTKGLEAFCYGDPEPTEGAVA